MPERFSNLQSQVAERMQGSSAHSCHHRWLSIIGLFLLFPSLIFSRTITIDSKPAAGQATVADLDATLGLPWKLMQMPVPFFEELLDFDSIDARNGWLIYDDTPQVQGSQIWRLVEGVWEPVDLGPFKGRDLYRVFATHHHDVWVTIQVPPSLKHNLLHYDGQAWTEVVTPNSDRIRALAMSSTSSGWAGCEWGQLLRFDGKSWSLYPSPTFHHIVALNFMADSPGYALLRAKNKPYSFLKYDGQQWLPFKPGAEGWQHVLMGDVFRRYIDFGLWINSENETVKWMLAPAVHQDTLIITLADQPERFLLSHLSGSVLSGKLARSFLNAPDSAWIACVAEEPVPLGDHTIVVLHFINKAGGKRDLVLRITRPRRAQYLFRQTPLFSSSRYTAEHGIAVADFNGDGLEDLYAVVTGGANHLFLRHSPAPDRAYSEQAAAHGVAGATRLNSGLVNYDEGAAAADVDNDGDQDIIVTSLYGPDVLFRQIRQGRFREESSAAGIGNNMSRSCSAVFADVNGDGAVDLYVSSEDSSNRLYLNNGAGVFTDVTRSAGLWFNRGGGGSVFADIDGDLDPDLFVPRYSQRNLLFINEGPTAPGGIPVFREQGVEAGVAGADTLSRSTSAVFADIDNDGDLDLLVTNLAAENELYRNDGKGRFTDITHTAGLVHRDMSQTALFLDVDNDGDLDLLCGNSGLSRYYENQGGGVFIEQTRLTGIYKPSVVTGMASLDLDDDGDIDVYLGQDAEPSLALQNTTDNGHFLCVRALGDRSNRDAIGARISVYKIGFAGQKSALLGMREVSGGSGFNSMSSRTAHFGLPEDEQVDLQVVYPSGIVRTLQRLQRGQTVTVYESESWARRAILMGKWLERNRRSSESQMLFAVIALALLLLSGTQWYFWRVARWPRQTLYLQMIVPFLLLTVLLYTLGELTPSRYYPLAVGVAALAWGLAFALHRSQHRRQSGSSAEMETLYLATTTFFHGEWAGRKLNRIEFFCQNLSAGPAPPPQVIAPFIQAIDDYFRLLVPELERILDQASAVGLPGAMRRTLDNAVLNLAAALNLIKVDLRTDRLPQFDETMRLCQALRTELESLRRYLEKYFIAPVHEIMEKAGSEPGKPGIPLLIENRISPPLMARLPAAALSQILENMLDNARRAVAETVEKRIRLQVDANSEFVFIRVFDSGPGVPAAVAANLFHEQVSTKARPGGFGLYHAKKMLGKYGGDIRLMERTVTGDETGFELLLKRVAHD